MLLTCLHAGRRDDPQRLVHIDLGPLPADDLASACGGENGKFQRQRGNRFTVPQLPDKFGDALIGQSLVMAARQPRPGRQDLCDMSAPACRVFAVTVAPRLGGIENGFDPPAHPACRLSLLLPDRLEDLEYMGGANLGHRHFTDRRIDVGRKRGLPLLAVLVIAPAALVRADIGFGHLLERDPRHLRRPCRRCCFGSLALPLGQRINALFHREAERRRLVARC